MIRYREILGKKLLLLREINGSVTQEQLGMLLGYSSNSAISLIESGERGMSQEELEFYVLFETAFKCESPLLPAVKTLLREAARCAS